MKLTQRTFECRRCGCRFVSIRNTYSWHRKPLHCTACRYRQSEWYGQQVLPPKMRKKATE